MARDVLDQVKLLGGSLGLDVVLLDIAMPGRDGLRDAAAIAKRAPTLPVLMLSTYPETQYADALHQGWVLVAT